MKSLFACIFFILPFFVMAEGYTIIDTTRVEFFYDYTYQKDSTNKSKLKHDNMVLQIGKRNVKFLSYGWTVIDSANYVYRDLPFEESIKFVGPIIQNNLNTTFTNFELYKNYPKKGNYRMESYPSGTPNLRIDEKVQLDWTIDMEKDTTILDYSCHYATCRYAGRDYRAWFTMDVPISDGPYKFGGLPGLIVFIEDSQSQHVYSLYKVSHAPRTMLYVAFDDFVEVTPEEMVKIFRTNIQKRYREITAGKKILLSDKSIQAKMARIVISYNNFVERY